MTIPAIRDKLGAAGSIPLTYPRSLLEPDVEQCTQQNLVCLQTLKHGFFCDQDRVRRLSFCRGDGAFVQAGATKVGNQSVAFGLGGLGSLLIGS